MDEFSYMSMLLSVVIGLAIAQILKGYRGIVLARVRVQPYWPVPALVDDIAGHEHPELVSIVRPA